IVDKGWKNAHIGASDTALLNIEHAQKDPMRAASSLRLPLGEEGLCTLTIHRGSRDGIRQEVTLVIDHLLIQDFPNGRVDTIAWLLYAQQLFMWFHQDTRKRISGRMM